MAIMLPVISSCTKILLVFFIASPSSFMFNDVCPVFEMEGVRARSVPEWRMREK
jgi:hypothetical protein